MSDLKSRLAACAEQWSMAHDAAPLSRLGKLVAGDANFFARIAAPSSSLNVKTLEKFATHLGDPASWPDGLVPQEVQAFVHRVEGRPHVHANAPIALQQSGSTGQTDHASTEVAEARS